MTPMIQVKVLYCFSLHASDPRFPDFNGRDESGEVSRGNF